MVDFSKQVNATCIVIVFAIDSSAIKSESAIDRVCLALNKFHCRHFFNHEYLHKIDRFEALFEALLQPRFFGTFLKKVHFFHDCHLVIG